MRMIARARRPIMILAACALVLAGVGVALAQATSTSHSLRRNSIQSLLASMTLQQKVGQMMMVSFAGTTLSPQAKAMIQQVQPGGITLFGDNFSSPAQLASLDAATQRASRVPLIISVDQEGGEVIRITSGVKQLPSEYAYGRQDDPSLVRSDAATEAKQLRRLGINMNLAPVLDIASQSSIIGEYDRSYGPTSSLVTSLGLAAIKGYQSNGVAATAKHIVGLGTTSVDPETTLPYLDFTATELANLLSPFKAAAKAGVDGIMVTHVVLNGVTGKNTPASLSHKVVTGILRQQFAYNGVIMTDSLTMGAVTSRFGLPTACRMAVGAGEDILLIAAGGETQTNLYQECVNSVVDFVNAGKASMNQIDESVTRILTLKQKLGLKLP